MPSLEIIIVIFGSLISVFSLFLLLIFVWKFKKNAISSSNINSSNAESLFNEKVVEMIKNLNATNQEHLDILANTNNNLLSTQIKMFLDKFDTNFNTKISNLEKSSHTNEQTLTAFKTTSQNIDDKVKKIDTHFTDMFLSNTNKGQFGEWKLEQILNKLLGDNNKLWERQKSMQIEDDGNIKTIRPDAIIFGYSNLPDMPIDSKFPTEAFKKYMLVKVSNSSNTSDVEKARKALRKDLKISIKSVAKYLNFKSNENDMNPTCALMFIPADNMLSMINTNLPEVLEDAFNNKVIMVGPTMLSYYIIQVREWQKLWSTIQQNQKLLTVIKKWFTDKNAFTTSLVKVQNVQEKLNKEFQQLIEKKWNKLINSTDEVLKHVD